MMSLLIMFLRDRFLHSIMVGTEGGECIYRSECNRRVKIAKLCPHRFGREKSLVKTGRLRISLVSNINGPTNSPFALPTVPAIKANFSARVV